jgi:hypothetical protein
MPPLAPPDMPPGAMFGGGDVDADAACEVADEVVAAVLEDLPLEALMVKVGCPIRTICRIEAWSTVYAVRVRFAECIDSYVWLSFVALIAIRGLMLVFQQMLNCPELCVSWKTVPARSHVLTVSRIPSIKAPLKCAQSDPATSRILGHVNS